MTTQMIESNEISYNAAISACERCARWQHALQLYVEVCMWTCIPKGISLGGVISACKDSSQWPLSLMLLASEFRRWVEEEDLVMGGRRSPDQKYYCSADHGGSFTVT